jgi:hypothetical protein
MAERERKGVLNVFAGFLGLAATYHFVGLFVKVNEASPWRHAAFVGIDLFFAYGLLRRPKYFVFLFLAFLVQQYYSHGARLINGWVEKEKVDGISLLVLVILPIVFFISW